MALALADSLAACNGVDEHDLMTRFLNWTEDGAYSSNGRCFDIGNTVRGALNRFRMSGNPVSGATDAYSAGNGSLMRLAPVAIRYWDDPDQLQEAAARQSRTTHGAAEAVDACVAFAGLLASAIAGTPRTKVLDNLEPNSAGAIGPILAGSWRGKPRDAIRSSGYVAHSLEAALWCVARTGSFAEAVLLAANLGDDADTVAAITGQLAGAIYGRGGIPPSWREQLSQYERIEQFAAALFDHTGKQLGPCRD